MKHILLQHQRINVVSTRNYIFRFVHSMLEDYSVSLALNLPWLGWPERLFWEIDALKRFETHCTRKVLRFAVWNHCFVIMSV
jgi:hypothetical protein